MSDKVLCIGLPNLSVEVYDISGEYMGTIRLAHPCRQIVLSRCGRFVAISTTNTILLYYAGEDGDFGMLNGQRRIYYGLGDNVSKKLLEVDNYLDDRGGANCMTFSPNSLFFSVCTVENLVYTYSIQAWPAEPLLVYKFDRRIDRTTLPESYYGITSLAL